MAYDKMSTSRLVSTYLALWVGCAVFAFPFLWMLLTSFKTPTEMDSSRLQLLPRMPRPQAVSPCMDTERFVTVKASDSIPDAVWKAAKPQLIRQLEATINA